MVKKFENILAQNESEEITEQELDELAEELSPEVEERIKRAKTKDKEVFWFNCSKVFTEHNIPLHLRFKLTKKIKDILKTEDKKDFKNPNSIVDDAYTVQEEEESRAGQTYADSDL